MTPQYRLERYERRTEWPLAGVALLFLGLYSIRVLVQPHGVAFVAVHTATLASWIVQRVSEEDTASHAATAAEIDALQEEIRRLAESVNTERRDVIGDRMEGSG